MNPFPLAAFATASGKEMATKEILGMLLGSSYHPGRLQLSGGELAEVSPLSTDCSLGTLTAAGAERAARAGEANEQASRPQGVVRKIKVEMRKPKYPLPSSVLPKRMEVQESSGPEGQSGAVTGSAQQKGTQHKTTTTITTM